jgi:uncharacterized integral membrane protein
MISLSSGLGVLTLYVGGFLLLILANIIMTTNIITTIDINTATSAITIPIIAGVLIGTLSGGGSQIPSPLSSSE